MTDFLFPDVGEGIQEGKVVSVKVSEGDNVASDQVLAEVETDKAVVEIPSPQAGTITTIHKHEGEIIKVGEPLVTFGEGKTERPHEQGTKQVESALVPKLPEEHEVPEAQPVPVVENAQGPTTTPSHRILAAPSTRRLAREKGIDIASLQGTGPHGRVTQQDVLGASGTPKPVVERPIEQGTKQVESTLAPQIPEEKRVEQTPTPSGETSSIPYAGRRKVIGDHMTTAHEIPPVTEFAEVDVTELVELRNHLKPRAAEQGVKLNYLPFIAKAACAAIHKHPIMNSTLGEKEITIYPDIHLGIAVDTEKGLVVPVIPVADKKSVLQLGRDVQTLGQAAKENKLTLEQLQGGTFTITSIGPLRVEGFTPIINSPEAAILGVGAITEKPAVRGEAIIPRKFLTLSLTFDHRIVDGAEAARFLTDLVQLLEDPELLVLEGI